MEKIKKLNALKNELKLEAQEQQNDDNQFDYINMPSGLDQIDETNEPEKTPQAQGVGNFNFVLNEEV